MADRPPEPRISSLHQSRLHEQPGPPPRVQCRPGAARPQREGSPQQRSVCPSSCTAGAQGPEAPEAPARRGGKVAACPACYRKLRSLSHWVGPTLVPLPPPGCRPAMPRPAQGKARLAAAALLSQTLRELSRSGGPPAGVAPAGSLCPLRCTPNVVQQARGRSLHQRCLASSWPSHLANALSLRPPRNPRPTLPCPAAAPQRSRRRPQRATAATAS